MLRQWIPADNDQVTAVRFPINLSDIFILMLAFGINVWVLSWIPESMESDIRLLFELPLTLALPLAAKKMRENSPAESTEAP